MADNPRLPPGGARRLCIAAALIVVWIMATSLILVSLFHDIAALDAGIVYGMITLGLAVALDEWAKS